LLEDTVTLEGVSWKYEENQDWIIKELELRVGKGEFLLITGPNGSGKTTLCSMLNGLIPYNYRGGVLKGKITIAGNNTAGMSIADLSKLVGMVFQEVEAQFLTLSVEDELVFGPENLGVPKEEISRRMEWVLKLLKLEGYNEKSPFELSGGQKQRVAIGAALMTLPEILVLDEPTSDIDPIGKVEVLSTIRDLKEKLNMTIILVEHLTDDVALLADRALLLKDGRIILQGTPREFFGNVDTLKKNGVEAPQVSQVFHALRAESASATIPLSVDEFVQFLEPKLEVAKTNLKRFDEGIEVSKTSDDVPLIELEDLWHTYPDGTVALKGVNLTIPKKGPITALLGQNGSGKTTLAKHLNGILKPTKGDVIVDGLNTKSAKRKELVQRVGYIFQNPDHQIANNSVIAEVSYGLRNLGLAQEEINQRVKEVLEFLDITRYANEQPFLLPKGIRQRTVIASVLAMRPSVIVVDEPTTGQDAANSRIIMEMLKKLHSQGYQIVLITHNMNIASEYCGNTIIMSEGRILAQGSTRSVFSQTDVLRQAFLQPPPVCRVSQALSKRLGTGFTALSVSELEGILEPLLK
jgi:energy-coupling factor transporter ATP-binding protein EcfA2